MYLLFPTLQRDPRICQSIETVRATYAPTCERTPPSLDLEISRPAIRCIYPADRDPDYADRRDLELLPSVDCSPLLSPLSIRVVWHTAIFVDIGLAMRYFLEVMWLLALVGGANLGPNKMECPRGPYRVQCLSFM